MDMDKVNKMNDDFEFEIEIRQEAEVRLIGAIISELMLRDTTDYYKMHKAVDMLKKVREQGEQNEQQ